ncbi:MAG: hypothetical protein J7K26_02765 [Candidatus Aenigmarchaeota archaeon]|nr:hypothetical protein [Candidatus Aenigmarchaeota archaeon]
MVLSSYCNSYKNKLCFKDSVRHFFKYIKFHKKTSILYSISAALMTKCFYELFSGDMGASMDYFQLALTAGTTAWAMQSHSQENYIEKIDETIQLALDSYYDILEDSYQEIKTAIKNKAFDELYEQAKSFTKYGRKRKILKALALNEDLLEAYIIEFLNEIKHDKREIRII